MSTKSTSAPEASAAAAALNTAATNFGSGSELASASLPETPDTQAAYNEFLADWNAARDATQPAIAALATNIDDLHAEFVRLDAEGASGVTGGSPVPPDRLSGPR